MAKAEKLAPLDRPPAEVLDVEPKIESDADFDRAVSELAWIRSFKKTQEGALAQRIELLKREYAQKLFVTIVEEGKPPAVVGFADRERSLEEPALAYAKAHVKDFFAEGTKNRRFTHGIVAWKQGTLSVLPLAGESDKTILEKISQKLTLAGRIKNFLAALRLGRKFAADIAVRLTPSINKLRILEAFKSGALTNDQLKPFGCQVDRPAPEFWIDTTDYVLESASQETRS